MKRRRFNKKQIHLILEKYRNGMSIKAILDEYHISQATFYNWKVKYGHTIPDDPQEQQMLREDNERLKRMFADISLENLKLKIQLKNLEKKH